MNEPTPVILTNNLTRRFGPLTAVHALTLSVQRGEILAWSARMARARPRSSACWPPSWTPARARHGGRFRHSQAGRGHQTPIGYMSQQFTSSATCGSRRTSTSSPNLWRARSGTRERIERLLGFARMTDFTGRREANLSAGMKKSWGCCALIPRPDILLLDEPTTGVDPVSRREFRDILAELHIDGRDPGQHAIHG